MPNEFDVYAIKLTYANIPRIVEATKPAGWSLDHLQDNMEFNTEEFGMDTVLFMKLYPGTTTVATFSDEPSEPSIEKPYRLTDEIDPKFGIFRKIEKI